LVELADEDLTKPSLEALYDCIVNKEEVADVVKIPG
jgi:hypothetical protein